MKARIEDSETLRSISPADVREYLQARGWTVQRHVAGLLETLSNVERGLGKEQIILPLRRDLADYSLRMAELLDLLEEREHRSQLLIFRDITESSRDVFRVTWTGSEAQDGTIPVGIGKALIDGTYDMLRAAALATMEPRAAFTSRPPSQVSEYLDQSRFGQTERGSYTVSLLSPLNPELSGAEADELFEVRRIGVPFGRAVTSTLARSLDAVESAAERALRSNSLDPFVEAVPKGVSANLCRAIATTGQQEAGTSSLRVGFTWAPALAPPADIGHMYEIRREHIPVIDDAARELRRRAPIGGYSIVGHVVRLERGEHADIGTITIAGFIKDETHKVSVELAGPEYALAIAAHEERDLVRCRGRLERTGNRYWLRDASEFDLVPDDGQGANE